MKRNTYAEIPEDYFFSDITFTILIVQSVHMEEEIKENLQPL